MNKSELVDALSNSSGLTKADSARAIDALFGSSGVIARALRAEERVQITGFGTFEAKHRKARTGRNPRYSHPTLPSCRAKYLARTRT